MSAASHGDINRSGGSRTAEEAVSGERCAHDCSWNSHSADTSPPVVIRFKSIGSAPILKQPFYKITASHKYSAVVAFLRKELSWEAGAKGQENLVSRWNASRASP